MGVAGNLIQGEVDKKLKENADLLTQFPASLFNNGTIKAYFDVHPIDVFRK